MPTRCCDITMRQKMVLGCSINRLQHVHKPANQTSRHRQGVPNSVSTQSQVSTALLQASSAAWFALTWAQGYGWGLCTHCSMQQLHCASCPAAGHGAAGSGAACPTPRRAQHSRARHGTAWGCRLVDKTPLSSLHNFVQQHHVRTHPDPVGIPTVPRAYPAPSTGLRSWCVAIHGVPSTSSITTCGPNTNRSHNNTRAAHGNDLQKPDLVPENSIFPTRELWPIIPAFMFFHIISIPSQWSHGRSDRPRL